MKYFVFWLGILFVLTGISCSGTVQSDLKTVDSVDLSRYLGTWYGIAHIPTPFEAKCQGNTTANYSLKPNGDIKVSNTCLVSTRKGLIYDADIGKAWVVDKETNAKLKVSFVLGLFAGDYWITHLEENYQWVIVGHPSREYLWILAREPIVSDELYGEMMTLIAADGYDTSLIVKIPQSE